MPSVLLQMDDQSSLRCLCSALLEALVRTSPALLRFSHSTAVLWILQGLLTANLPCSFCNSARQIMEESQPKTAEERNDIFAVNVR